jgi:hypothetical protein
MDVIRTDPLTEARIALKGHVDPLGRASERVLTLAWLNSQPQKNLQWVDMRMTSSDAPLTIRVRALSRSASTETRRRSKSSGTSSILHQGDGSIAPCSRMALAEAVFMSVASGITGIVVGVLASKAISLSRAGKRRFLSWRLERDSCSQLA